MPTVWMGMAPFGNYFLVRPVNIQHLEDAVFGMAQVRMGKKPTVNKTDRDSPATITRVGNKPFGKRQNPVVACFFSFDLLLHASSVFPLGKLSLVDTTGASAGSWFPSVYFLG